MNINNNPKAKPSQPPPGGPGCCGKGREGAALRRRGLKMVQKCYCY